MAELFVNDVTTTLASTTTTSATSLTVASGTGLPSPTAGDYAKLRLEPAVPDGTFEIVNLTARSGVTLTVTRAQEGTTGVAWASGAKVSAVITNASLTTLQAAITAIGSLSVVVYSGSLSTTRPSATFVVWEGYPSQPTNMIDGDLWLGTGTATFLVGTAAPASGDGSDGDLWWNATTTTVYGPKASGSWPAGIPLGGGVNYDRAALLGPTGTIRANLDRTSASMNSINNTSGTLYLSAVYLYAGDVLTNVNMRVGGSTSISIGTHSWGVLADSSRVVLAVSADDTTATTGLSTTKTWAFGGSAYTVTTSGFYYVGFMQAATTLSSVGANAMAASQMNIPPISAGTSNTAQTTPPSLGATLTAITAVANLVPYVWLT